VTSARSATAPRPPTTSGPALSLVVCTRDRAAVLAPCLEALGALRCEARWELVLVDNGSRDETRARLDAFAREAKVPVTVVGEPLRGLGRARNAGVRASQGAVVAFTDDDCYPAPDFLDAVLQVFADPGVGYMGGRIARFDPADDPITTRDVAEPTPLPPYSFVPTGLIQGANMAARREVLFAVGLFDPALGPGTPFCNDDVDFVARAALAGFGGGYFPGPCVYHHHRRRSPDAVRALRSTYDFGRGAYYAKRLLDGPARGRYAKAFYWSMRRPPTAMALRELGGALRYVATRALGVLR
jgi:glycosyltransferase involved in cell wall biosynthesis